MIISLSELVFLNSGSGVMDSLNGFDSSNCCFNFWPLIIELLRLTTDFRFSDSTNFLKIWDSLIQSNGALLMIIHRIT